MAQVRRHAFYCIGRSYLSIVILPSTKKKLKKNVYTIQIHKLLQIRLYYESNPIERYSSEKKLQIINIPSRYVGEAILLLSGKLDSYLAMENVFRSR